MAGLSKKATNQDSSRLLIPRINFFSWFKIWTIPTVKMLYNMVTCDENWELNSEANMYTFSKIVQSNHPEWVVLFPEVNVYTLDAAAIQQEISAKYYLPNLRHLLYPRFSGIANAIAALNETSFSQLYDVTIVYYSRTGAPPDTQSSVVGRDMKTPHRRLPASALLPESSSYISRQGWGFSSEVDFKAPSLLDIFAISPSPYRVRVHLKRRLWRTIPTKRRKLEKYIENHWCEKDRLIASLRQEIRSESSSSIDGGT